MKHRLLLVWLCCIHLPGIAQDKHLVDSFERQLKNHRASKLDLKMDSPSLYDTSAANYLYELSKAFWESNRDTALYYANQSLALSEQIGYKKGMGNAYNSIAAIETYNGDYVLALEHNKEALKIREEIGDKKGVAGTYGNIGVIYKSQGNYSEALENYFLSLKLSEEIGNKNGTAMALNNIGLIYFALNNLPEALKNHLSSLKIQEEIGNKNGIAMCHVNLANVYAGQGKQSEALKSYLVSLKLMEEIGNKYGISIVLNNIGEIYFTQSHFSEALEKYFACLKIEKDLGDKYGMANSHINIGKAYIKISQYKGATEFLTKALSLSKEIGSLEFIQTSYGLLATLDSAQGNFNKALEHYKLFITFRDSLVNNENTKKTVIQQMNYDFSKQQDSLNTVQATKDMIAHKELQKEKIMRNGFVGGFAVVLLFAGVFFRQRNKTKKEKLRAEEERNRSEDLLLNILPQEVASELKATGTAKAKAYTMVTVMFTDFKDFTSISEKVSAELLVDEIHTCFSAFDYILQKHKIEKIKTIGDAYLCASGLPVSNYTHATDMLNAAFEIRNYMVQRKKEKEAKGEVSFELRIGIHTGPVVAGIVGVRKYAYDIWGDTVNLAARMEQNSEAGKINISGSTYELVKDKFKCAHRGKIQAKNKGEIDMYFVETLS